MRRARRFFSRIRGARASVLCRVTAAKSSLTALLALGFAARAQEHGRLLEVRAGGDAQVSAVELLGDRPLSFTTLKLAGPPRVVVDLADTDLLLAERELQVDDGTVRRVAAAAAGSRTARVVIELAAEAEFDVRAVGNRVEVRVPRLAPLLAKAEPESVAKPEEPSPSLAKAEEPAPAAAPQDEQKPEIVAKLAEPPAEGAPPAESQAPAAAEETEAQKRASLPKVALVGSRPALGDAPPAEEARKRAREERIAAYAEAQREAAEQVAAARKESARRAAEKKSAEKDRLAVAKEAAEQKRLAAAEKKARAAEQAALEKKAPAASQPHSAPAEKSSHKLALAASPHNEITGIGFRPIRGGEVIVRSDHPLEYGVSGEDNAVLLHLPSTAIPLSNNRRPLDTRFFDGPVQRVVPVAVAGGTDVRIELKGRAEYQLEQSGSVLTVRFNAQ